MKDKASLRTTAISISASQNIPAHLVLAIGEVESGWNNEAWNPEPMYHYLWDVKHNRPFRHLSHEEDFSESPPDDFHSLAGARDAEWWGQQASWGPMQIMGAVAREYGYRRHFPGLCSDVKAGVYYAVKHLSMLHVRFYSRYGWPGVVAAYNAGSVRWDNTGETVFVNQGYVDKVKAEGGLP